MRRIRKPKRSLTIADRLRRIRPDLQRSLFPTNITISSKAMFFSVFFSIFLLSGAAFGFLVWCETDILREAMVLKSERMREVAIDECFSPTLTLIKRIGENLNAGK